MKGIKPHIKLYCLIITILFASPINAQSIIDSLKTELCNAKSLDLKISMMIDIGIEYADINSDSARVYLTSAKNKLEENPNPFLKAEHCKAYGLYLIRDNKTNDAILQYKNSIRLFTKVDSLSKLASVNNLIGNCFVDTAMYDSALHYYQLSVQTIDSAENSSLLAANYNNMANVYENLDNQEKALSYYLTALSMFRELQQPQQEAIALNNIGLINLNLENYEKAISFFKEAIELNQQNDNIFHLCMNYNNLGITYKELDDYEKAESYFSESVNKSEEAGFNSLVAQSNHNLGSLYLKMEKYDLAIMHLERSLEICRDNSIVHGEIYNLSNIANVYLKLKQFDPAETYLLTALDLAQSHNRHSIVSNIYNLLFKVYEESGKFEKAVEYYKLYETIKDSLYDIEKARQLNELQTKYETEQKELENQQLKNRNKINELKITRQKNVMIATSLIVALSLIILTILVINKTKRKKQFALLRDKNKLIEEKSLQLERSNETKNMLFSIIAHDLRSPFTSLLGISSLLNQDVESGNFKNVAHYTKQLLNISGNTFDLVDNLLNWTKSQQEKITPEPTLVPLIGLVKNATDALLSKADEKQIKIETCIVPGTMVYVDANMLKVVLRNLLSNAIKFTYKGGRIEVGCDEKPDHHVVFVKDNGQGIGADVKRTLFNNKAGFTTSGTESEPGSGLGLLLVTDFVKMLGGKIWVDSAPGKGSTFCFSIPKGKN